MTCDVWAQARKQRFGARKLSFIGLSRGGGPPMTDGVRTGIASRAVPRRLEPASACG